MVLIKKLPVGSGDLPLVARLASKIVHSDLASGLLPVFAGGEKRYVLVVTYLAWYLPVFR